MDYTRLANERITNTKIGRYDMITAISQRAINKQLEVLHKANKSLRKLSLASEMPKFANFVRLDADFGPPTIELRLKTENRIVLFCLNILKATLHYVSIDSDNMKPVETSVEIPACTLAVAVNLAFKSVEFTKLPQEVQDRLISSNNYSVQQLFIDFANINLAKVDKQSTTVQNHIEDSVARAHFDIFIARYFAEIAQKNNFVLHYVPLATKTMRHKYAMPNVPPTDITFQNMPFIQTTEDDVGPNENNMLVYLQMCNDHFMPKEALANSANWVVPTLTKTGRYDGTVALSADIFLNGWFLKKLSDFNRSSTWVVTEAWWKRSGLSANFNIDGKLGLTDGPDSVVAWDALNTSDVNQDVRNQVSGQIGQWYKYYHFSDKKDDDGAYEVWQKGTTTNWLFIPEGDKNGKCEIFVCGSTFIEFYVQIGIPSSTGWVKGEWGTKIVLEGVNDGELSIKADPINPKITRKIDEAWLHSGQITKFSKPAEDALSALSMSHIVDDMSSVFKNSWDFVIPGGGDFFINKAVFNREKDLICELRYKTKTS